MKLQPEIISTPTSDQPYRRRTTTAPTLVQFFGILTTMTSLRPWSSSFLACYVITTSLFLRHSADAISLAPVSWNISNPMFKTSKNDHVIEVKLYDDIDFVCPFYPPGPSHSADNAHHLEYYIIYLVSRAEYRDCNIYDDSAAVMMLNCSNPQQRKRFTILFEPFQSIPNVPEYHAGRTYYFITTSTGGRHGLSNLYQGACSHRNMKLTVRVCCQTTTARPAVKSLSESSNTVDSPGLWQQPTDSSQLAPPSEYSPNLQSRVTSPPLHNLLHPTTVRQHHKWRQWTVEVQTPASEAAAGVGAGKTIGHKSSIRPPPAPAVDTSHVDINDVAKSHVEDFSAAKHAGLVTNGARWAWRRVSHVTVTSQLVMVATVLRTVCR